ncbi:MAG: response regulator transcription factor [Aggregatilineales bacterium]
MDKLSVLVADDDPRIRKLVNVNLTQRNYLVQEAENGEAVLEYLEQKIPDLIILDLVMPGMKGDDVCVWIRRRGIDIPIMVLSAYDEEDLKVRALDAGADDYVTKPFKAEEFLARLRALMRRSGVPEPSQAENKVVIEGITVDLKGRRAFVDGVDMHLTRTEIALLATLAESHDSVLTHDELLAKVWGEEYRGSSHYLHVYLGRIRKKMGDKYSMLLETVAGLGYVLHSTVHS